ncbi:ROK family protein [Paenibacillus rigui]|uniref:Sugar kinase n=1 Tax=Paenibacillus rigui TaxID=554312 RepID=A0A229UJ95_9BACL|nr:ROK family protein [Paenibacillus rigui]OXM83466.1 sugar kinase [Paenibacillus rigui]
MGLLIGMDIGGTNIVCGLVDEEGRLMNKIKKTTEAHKGSEYVFDKIQSMIKELLQLSDVPLTDISAIGAGTPGFIDPVRGVTLFAGNLKWKDVPTAEEIRKRTGIPAFIDNDVRMYAYGEAVRGAAQGYEHVLGITIGTGLAAAVVNNGELYYGGGYMAGEIGHFTFPEHIPYVCGCGMTGCLETVASATGMARQAKDLLRGGRVSVLQEWFKDTSIDHLTAADVSRAYDLGDPVAVEVMNHTGRLLGRGLAYAVTMYSPDMIVIGGGGALAGERLFAPMREQLKQSVYSGYWERLAIATAQNIDDAGIIGSALSAGKRAATR